MEVIVFSDEWRQFKNVDVYGSNVEFYLKNEDQNKKLERNSYMLKNAIFLDLLTCQICCQGGCLDRGLEKIVRCKG